MNILFVTETYLPFIAGVSSSSDSIARYMVSQGHKVTLVNPRPIIDKKIMELKASAQASADKIKFLSSEVAIKYMEADLVKAESDIDQLEHEKKEKTKEIYTINMDNVMERIGYFLEHLEELLIDTANPLKRAAFFGLIFDGMPTYSDLTSGTPRLAPYLGLKHHFGTASVPVGEAAGTRTQDP